MAPELLPAIMTIAMSTGAKRMADKKVVVKKLSAIQNLGEVNLFCSDKTGTLTEGVLKVNEAVDVNGKESSLVRKLAYINATLQKGYPNPLDDALRLMPDISIEGSTAIGEISYDFLRKRLSIAIQNKDGKMLISKGALNNILESCTQIDLGDGNIQALQSYKDAVAKQYESYSNQGFRTIGVCYKPLKEDIVIDAHAECDMIYAGMLLLFDPPKEGVIDIIRELKSNGVELKVITGDNRLIAQYMADKIGLKDIVMLAGPDMGKLSDTELAQKASLTNVFAEIEPQQKERIIKALRNDKTTVAYMGDGINDVAAIHAADVGISTNNAVDVAKEAADVVLLEKDLSVLNAGIIEGRRTFLNTIKYIYINTSATFGNMFSVAGASLLLPFLPMLPKQILMTNFLTDFPYMSVASDSVDEELLKVPQRWDMKRIRRFMLLFGMHSSFFDFLTFFILYKVLHSDEHQFRSGWFLESVATELLILFIVRTHKSVLKSKPGKLLMILNVLAMIITFALPYTPLADVLELKRLPLHTISAIAGILLAYVLTADLLKVWFFRKQAA
jgi:Mg2+-importing ATPase